MWESGLIRQFQVSFSSHAVDGSFFFSIRLLAIARPSGRSIMLMEIFKIPEPIGSRTIQNPKPHTYALVVFTFGHTYRTGLRVVAELLNLAVSEKTTTIAAAATVYCLMTPILLRSGTTCTYKLCMNYIIYMQSFITRNSLVHILDSPSSTHHGFPALQFFHPAQR